MTATMGQTILPTMSMMIHADSKVGKSTLSNTAPPPICVFDAEGSTKFLPFRGVVPWNPKHGPPPAWDGSWEACMVIVEDFDTLVKGADWLETGQHHFRSVNLDSISEIQRKLKDKIKAGGKFEWDDWGELLRRMDHQLRRIRDLTQHPVNPVMMTVFVAETRLQSSGRYEPNLEGALRTAAPYWFDIIGYLKVENVRNQDGSPAFDQYGDPFQVRQLLTRPVNPLYYAGERVQARVPAILSGAPTSTAPASMWEATPNLTRDVLFRVFPHLAQPQQSTQAVNQ